MNNECKLSYIKGQQDLIEYIKKEANRIANDPDSDAIFDLLLLLQKLKPIPKGNIR